MSIASFGCDSFHSIDTSIFSSLNENHILKNLIAKFRESFDIFVFPIIQPRVNDPLFNYRGDKN